RARIVRSGRSAMVIGVRVVTAAPGGGSGGGGQRPPPPGAVGGSAHRDLVELGEGPVAEAVGQGGVQLVLGQVLRVGQQEGDPVDDEVGRRLVLVGGPHEDVGGGGDRVRLGAGGVERVVGQVVGDLGAVEGGGGALERRHDELALLVANGG